MYCRTKRPAEPRAPAKHSNPSLINYCKYGTRDWFTNADGNILQELKTKAKPSNVGPFLRSRTSRDAELVPGSHGFDTRCVPLSSKRRSSHTATILTRSRQILGLRRSFIYPACLPCSAFPAMASATNQQLPAKMAVPHDAPSAPQHLGSLQPPTNAEDEFPAQGRFRPELAQLPHARGRHKLTAYGLGEEKEELLYRAGCTAAATRHAPSYLELGGLIE
ncbi:hypothetical protein NM208_g14672 [Fusarium decemcellulare]|uniref:Uncharacterized protein n=1 Tax=Fusarium decemcellulare TaxID=57161 RepID=A0ACC1RHS5_9HYPO|nr:hypothetical protein NM208_g14672 [Fusarium decemcellulare]